MTIKRYDFVTYGDGMEPVVKGQFVTYDDHIADKKAAVKQAREDALEEAAKVLLDNAVDLNNWNSENPFIKDGRGENDVVRATYAKHLRALKSQQPNDKGSSQIDPNDELLPCPFCGSSAETMPSSRLPPTLDEALTQPPNVRCSSGQCGARYCPGGFPIAEWNKRPLLQSQGRETPYYTLNVIANEIQHWLDFQEQERKNENLPMSDSTCLMAPPYWPTRGMLKSWIRELRSPTPTTQPSPPSVPSTPVERGKSLLRPATQAPIGAPKTLPDLIVTRGDGIPLPDQAAAIEEFKNQARRPQQPSTPGVVDGMVMVPRDPTEAMQEAGVFAITKAGPYWKQICVDIFKAMLAEAPASTQPAPGGGWISARTKLPKENEECFFIPTSGSVFVGFYKDKYFHRVGGRYTQNVVHWWYPVCYPLPLPTPTYADGGKE